MPQMNARQKAAAEAARQQAKFEAEVKRKVKQEVKKLSPTNMTPAQKMQALKRGLP